MPQLVQTVGTACRQWWARKGEEFHTSDQNNLPGTHSKGGMSQSSLLKDISPPPQDRNDCYCKRSAKLHLIEGENRTNFPVKDQSPSPQHCPYWSIRHALGFKSSSSLRKNLSAREMAWTWTMPESLDTTFSKGKRKLIWNKGDKINLWYSFSGAGRSPSPSLASLKNTDSCPLHSECVMCALAAVLSPALS